MKTSDFGYILPQELIAQRPLTPVTPLDYWYWIGLGPVYGRMVTLLTTIGRKSGQPRVTPMQYQEIAGLENYAANRAMVIINPRIEESKVKQPLL